MLGLGWIIFSGSLVSRWRIGLMYLYLGLAISSISSKATLSPSLLSRQVEGV